MALSFTRPQYVELARIIALMPSSYRADVALHFSDVLAKGSRTFDRERFIAAAIGKPSQARDIGISDL
jgi:hypothetical protein